MLLSVASPGSFYAVYAEMRGETTPPGNHLY
jgi:hypothetical protein